MNIIDRRLNPKSKSLGNRQRFVRRAKADIREAVKDALKKRKVTEVEGSREDLDPLQERARAPVLARPRCRQSRLRAARQQGIQGRRPHSQAAGRRGRWAWRPGQPGRLGRGRFRLHAVEGRVSRPVLRGPEAPQSDQDEAQGSAVAGAAARRLHDGRTSGEAQPRAHHAAQSGPAHRPATAKDGGSPQARGGARRSRKPIRRPTSCGLRN